jgi:hypothetical protein
MSILHPRVRDIQIPPIKLQSSRTLLKRLWLNFSNLWRTPPYIKFLRRYPHENNGMYTSETGCIGGSDFTVVRYSVPSNGITRNSRFPIQGNVVKVNKRKYLHVLARTFSFALNKVIPSANLADSGRSAISTIVVAYLHEASVSHANLVHQLW